MEQLFFADDSNHAVIQELRQSYEPQSLSSLDHLQRGDEEVDTAGVVIDLGLDNTVCRQSPANIFKKSMDSGIPVVLLNCGDAGAMAGFCGVGIASDCMIARPQQNGSLIVDVLDASGTELEEDYRSMTVEQSSDGRRVDGIVESGAQKQDPDKPMLSEFAILSDRAKARIVEEVLSTHDENEFERYSISQVEDNPGDLPRDQVKTTYIKLPLSRPIDGRKEAQHFTNQVVMAVTLLASFDNPPYKYLRIETLGSGFAPASGGYLHWNRMYDRGWFQNRIEIHMEPRSQDLTTLQSSPRNVSKQHTVTTGTSVNVGVDISKNPSFKSSYTISNSQTEVIDDFEITNKSSGVVGKWYYQLSMTAGNFLDLFDQPTLRKARVKALPTLARANLQTSCAVVWYVPKTYDKTVPVQLDWSAAYYNGWVTGYWLSYAMHGKGWTWKQIGTIVHVNFAEVSA